MWGREQSARLKVSTAVGLFMSLSTAPGFADPTNPNVVAGSAAISNPASGTTVVEQSSPRTIIEWDTFDVGTGEAVVFTQPSTDAIALNRVTGGQGPSGIDGQIDANGRIVITNEDGIVFGDGAVIDVGALIATTADIDNDAFMNGSLDFNLSGTPDGQVVNRGSITARDGGLIALVAPQAENAGVLSARVGRVAVAGGDRFTVDFTASEFLTLAIDPDSPAGQYLASNSGRIEAEGGHVLLTTQTASDALSGVVNNSGIVEATAVDTSGGRIRLVAGGG
ncbi:MAG: filamentous hemagglutinin N-terminal domain-containing protein, partial [Pseudomonadota bacterium]